MLSSLVRCPGGRPSAAQRGTGRAHAGRVALADEVEWRLPCPPAAVVRAAAIAGVLAAAAQVARCR